MGRATELGPVVIMPHEATLIYSTALLHQAVFAFWRRSVGSASLLRFFIAAIGLVVLVALGQSSWIIGGACSRAGGGHRVRRCDLCRSLSSIATKVPPDGQTSSHCSALRSPRSL